MKNPSVIIVNILSRCGMHDVTMARIQTLNGISSSFPSNIIIPVSSNKEPSLKQFQTRVPPDREPRWWRFVFQWWQFYDTAYHAFGNSGKLTYFLRSGMWVFLWVFELFFEFFCGAAGFRRNKWCILINFIIYRGYKIRVRSAFKYTMRPRWSFVSWPYLVFRIFIPRFMINSL